MSDAEALPVQSWSLDDIKPYEKNAKLHDDEQIEALSRSIKRFGWTQPIVIDRDGVIIAGHGRRLAALSLGLTRAPVVCRTDLTTAEAEALRLADNRTTSTAYDTDLLREALQGLKDIEFDLADTGFGEHELNFMLADLGQIDATAFVDDIGEAVELQRAENEQHVQEIDEKELPISEAFGFKKMRTGDIRHVKAFMARIESMTGKTGPDALIAYLDTLDIAA
ncbi:chromosome partitioning protein ParB [Roseospira marina]|uniref:Chromosome partitioning protein ParB n=1 Tax=Roseospira marina TaxID=140057 RepID=A0A5M6I850_9PROT|nr:ParB N-terminal domain-containing protein [Roseospira marina]KAA5604416.1 chromosome partitioning protein ParB [Roseospira marina]MBB4315389.1 hypothetical protein [Roseospira marina]MBB5088466.1 hypothetical protein [Roseospira marina]